MRDGQATRRVAWLSGIEQRGPDGIQDLQFTMAVREQLARRYFGGRTATFPVTEAESPFHVFAVTATRYVPGLIG